jgi:hypothetical protein
MKRILALLFVVLGFASSSSAQIVNATRLNVSEVTTDTPGTLSIADNGGGTHATATLTPTTTNVVLITCSDTDGV